MVLGVVPASGRAVAAICELPVTSRHWGYAGLGLLAAGFVLGQHPPPTEYHLVSEEVLATIDLVKEIDSVQNRELRLSRAVISVCTAIKAIPRSSTYSPGSSPTTMTMEQQRSLVPARYSSNSGREC